MLNFLRRYQRLFFVIITAVIVVSFSFFGTYQGLFQGNRHGETAFTAINGKKISQRQLAQMVLFLSTESDLPWGNPLNDGVLSRHFLESGMAAVLALHHQEALEGELLLKGSHEAHYLPYRHPYAPMLGAELIWSSFAPDLKQGIDALKADLPFKERFEKRADLFLAEKAFPQASLKQMIRYQEGQLNGLPQDQDLPQRDLSLFGYHTLEDWFGSTFLSLSAQFIVNASILAEEKGYIVSKKEAYADLIRNAELAAIRMPTVYTGSGKDALDTILRRNGMTPNEAIGIWQKVLLFRRLFQDTGSAPLMDTLPFDRFSEFAGENAPIVHYTLPGKPNLKNGDDLIAFESYLDAVYERDRQNLASLPVTPLSLSETMKHAPELVYREYTLAIKAVNREKLAAEIPMRDVWNWQLQDGNWETLETRIPTLEKQQGERFSRLKALDKKNREKADEMARKAILKSRPERILTALAVAEEETKTLRIPHKGTSPLKGVEPKFLMEKLADSKEAVTIVGDEVTYEVTLVQPPSEDKVFVYHEAKEAQALRLLADRKIEEGYQERKERSKPLSQVKEELIASLTKEISKEIYEKTDQPDKPDAPTAAYAAKMRFFPHMEFAKENLTHETTSDGLIHARAADPITTQWEVERATSKVLRGQTIQGLAFESLEPGMVSDIQLDTMQGTTFFKVGEREKGEFDNPRQYDQIQAALSYEVEKQLLQTVLAEIDARGGMELIQHGEEG